MGDLRPGILEWERPGGAAEWELFEHVIIRETGGVVAFEADQTIGQPTKRLLELGPSTPWNFRPIASDDELPDNLDPEDGPVAVPALGPDNSEVP